MSAQHPPSSLGQNNPRYCNSNTKCSEQQGWAWSLQSPCLIVTNIHHFIMGQVLHCRCPICPHAGLGKTLPSWLHNEVCSSFPRCKWEQRERRMKIKALEKREVGDDPLSPPGNNTTFRCFQQLQGLSLLTRWRWAQGEALCSDPDQK